MSLMTNTRRYFHSHVKARIAALLSLPIAWLGVLYIGSLAALFITSIWKIDTFTSKVVREFTLSNFIDILTDKAYFNVTMRTVGVAVAVTIICAVLAIPMAFFIARVAKPKSRPVLIALVITPLWASYLVKIYAWRTMLEPNSGVIDWLLGPIGIHSPGFGFAGIIIGLSYLWLPYMILPIYAGFERLPNSLLDASGDLGAKNLYTLRRVVLPILFPSIVAGSMFTFSLSLGDYITATIIGGKLQMLGNVVYQNYSLNLPFAATMSMVPIAIMGIYLWAVRRTGALTSL